MQVGGLTGICLKSVISQSRMHVVLSVFNISRNN